MTYHLISSAEAMRPQADSSGQQTGPVVAALSDGGAIVAWASQRDAASSYGYDVMAQRYDAEGNPVGAPEVVYSGPDDEAGVGVNVVGLAGGGWAIAWLDQDADDMRVRSYDAAGQIASDELLDLPDRSIDDSRDVEVSVSSSGYGASTLVALDSGGFALVWNAGYAGMLAQYTGAGTAYSQVFDASGQTVSGPTQVAPWIGTARILTTGATMSTTAPRWRTGSSCW